MNSRGESMKIAVVDDNKTTIDFIEQIVEKCSFENKLYVEIETYTSGINLLYEMEEGKSFDLFLLDIEMPGMCGLTLAKRIREMTDYAYIVFITSYMQYAIHGYEVKAYRYITKDNLKQSIEEILPIICDNLEEEKNEYYIINTNNRYEKIFYRDIFYMIKEGKDTIFVTKKGKTRERKSIIKVYNEIGHPTFAYINKGIVINISKINSLKSGILQMEDETEFQVSRTHLQTLKEEIRAYWGKRI